MSKQYTAVAKELVGLLADSITESAINIYYSHRKHEFSHLPAQVSTEDIVNRAVQVAAKRLCEALRGFEDDHICGLHGCVHDSDCGVHADTRNVNDCNCPGKAHSE